MFSHHPPISTIANPFVTHFETFLLVLTCCVLFWPIFSPFDTFWRVWISFCAFSTPFQPFWPIFTRFCKFSQMLSCFHLLSLLSVITSTRVEGFSVSNMHDFLLNGPSGPIQSLICYVCQLCVYLSVCVCAIVETPLPGGLKTVTLILAYL